MIMAVMFTSGIPLPPLQEGNLRIYYWYFVTIYEKL